MGRIARDKWTSRDGNFIKLDKIEHLIGGFAMALLWGPIESVLFWLAWEIKDAFVPYEKKFNVLGYNLGGDGFSMKDWLASVAGSVVATVVMILFFDNITGPQNVSWYWQFVVFAGILLVANILTQLPNSLKRD